MLKIVLSILILCLQGTEIKEVEQKIRPYGYEVNLSTLDRVRSEGASLAKDEVIVVVSRLGKGEKFVYNHRRLYTVKAWLKLPDEKIVTATGEPVNGYGILEFYIRGKKVYVLAIDKNEELVVTEIYSENKRQVINDCIFYLPTSKVNKKRHKK